MIPKLTAPFAKAIRTLEGVLLAGATVAPWAVTLINPAALSKVNAEKWSVISAGILAVSRTIIKAVGATKAVTGIPPLPIDVSGIVQGGSSSAAEQLAVTPMASSSPPDGKG